MKRVLIALSVVLLVCAAPGAAAAFEYPTQPIQIITPSSPGGESDVFLRLLKEALDKYLPKPIVINNVPGAGGEVALAELRKCRPDGYTVLQAPVGLFTTKIHMKQVPYKVEDFKFIIGISSSPVVLAARATLPVKSIRDVVELSRRTPGGLSYATPGVGSLMHLAMEQISRDTGVAFRHVPFNGGAPAVTAAAGGHVDLVLVSPAELAAQVRAGNLHPIAVFSRQRDEYLPDTTTAYEQGYEYEHQVWKFLLVRKEVPDEVVQVLHDAVKRALADPGFLAQARKAELEVQYMSGADVLKEIKRENAIYKDIIMDLGLTEK